MLSLQGTKAKQLVYLVLLSSFITTGCTQNHDVIDIVAATDASVSDDLDKDRDCPVTAYNASTTQVSSDCPYGWVDHCQGFCAKIFFEKLSWFNASKSCTAHNASLVIPDTLHKYSVVKLLSKEHQQDVWLGLRAADQSGQWRWEDGRLAQDVNWSDSHHGNGSVDKRDCAAISHDAPHQLNAFSCFKKKLFYVCQLPHYRFTRTIDNIRLPTNVKPLSYDLRLRIDVSSLVTKGYLAFTFNCKQTSDFITLNVRNLQVDENEIQITSASSRLRVLVVEYVEEKEWMVVRLNRNMKYAEEYTLYIRFTGSIRSSKDYFGLYYYNYTLDDKEEEVVATYLSMAHAREVFPCMDEPALKAYFTLRLEYPRGMSAISNMPLDDHTGTTDVDGVMWREDNFKTTPLMSTYLLAFVLTSGYTHVTKLSNHNVTLGVSMPTAESRDKLQTEQLLDALVATTDFFQDYLQTNMLLPKLDNIAIHIPHAGMEYWGLVYYNRNEQNSNLLRYRPLQRKHYVREYIRTHEICHQWLGNLVTYAWWDDYWLSEGFANFMTTIAVDHFNPELELFDKISLVFMEESFASDDAEAGTVVKVIDPTKGLTNRHDNFKIYEKGSTIIRMLRHCIGHETFINGVREYLKTYREKSVTRDDLFRTLATLDLPYEQLSEFMSTYLTQESYPVVRVTRDRNNANLLRVDQQPSFKLLKNRNQNLSKPESDYSWTIPLTFASERNPKTNHTEIYWLDKRHQNLTVDLETLMSDNTSEWFLANVGVVGYYRVLYEVSNWNSLARQFASNHQLIPPMNRAQIMIDAWHFFQNGHLDLKVVLSILNYTEKERDWIPLEKGLGYLTEIYNNVKNTSIGEKVKSYIKKKLEVIYPDISEVLQLSRYSHYNPELKVAEISCRFGVASCLEDSRRVFARLMEDPDCCPMLNEYRDIVVCSVLRNASVEESKFVIDMLRNMSDYEQLLIFFTQVFACYKNDNRLSFHFEALDILLVEKLPETLTIHNVVQYFLSEQGIKGTLFYTYLKDYLLYNQEKLRSTTDIDLAKEVAGIDERLDMTLAKSAHNRDWVKRHASDFDLMSLASKVVEVNLAAFVFNFIFVLYNFLWHI